MRLTDILKSVLNSRGGEIVVGDLKLDGVYIHDDGDGLLINTVQSAIDSDTIRISSTTNRPRILTELKLSAISNVAYDEYVWEISGSPVFVDGINTGESVSIYSDIECDCVVTLKAFIDSELVKQTSKEIVYTKYLFEYAKIETVDVIDSIDSVVAYLDSFVHPDSVSWRIEGGGALSPSGNDRSVYIIPDESGTDIMIYADISKQGYIDRTISKAIAVDKCQISSGSAIVERPAIRQEDGWTIDDQGSVLVSAFHGLNSPSIIEYQVDNAGSDFVTPVVSNQVAYSNRISIDTTSIINGYMYALRIRFIDNLGNSSMWSEAVEFKVKDLETYIIDSINTSMFVPLNGDSGDLVSGNELQWTGSERYGSSPFGYSAFFDGSNAINTSAIDLSETKMISFSFLWDGTRGVSDWGTIIGSKIANGALNNIKLAIYGSKLSTYHNSSVQHLQSDELQKNRWYHLAIVEVAPGYFTYYLDGQLLSDSIPDNNASLDICYIGSDNNDGSVGETFTGQISNVRLSNEILTQEQIRLVYEKDRGNTINAIGHYWPMNTQPPKDVKGGMDGVSNFCELVYGIGFDNALLFNGSSSYVETPPFDVDHRHYTISARFMLTDNLNNTGIVVGINNADGGGNILLIEINSLTLKITAYNNTYSYGDDYDTYELSTNTEYIVVIAGTRVFVNDTLVYTLSGQNPISAGDRISFGMEYDSGLSIGNFFKGYIYEVIFFPLVLTDSDISLLSNMTERPIGGEKKYTLPCSVIDKPVILNDSGANILITKYYGVKDFSATEYQFFNITDLDYSSPVYEALFYGMETISVSSSVPAGEYKIRVRYIDVDNNKSPWSRISVFTKTD